MKPNLTPRLNRLEPNIMIDGGHEIWPAGTSVASANNTSAYGSVLMHLTNTSTGVTLTNSQQSSVPASTNLVFSNQVSKTAAGTLAAGTISRLRYGVEGSDVDKIYNDDFSVIFWVKSTVAATRSVAIRNGTNTHSYVQQYTINSTNTWEMKVVHFPALNTCPGTISRDNNLGVSITFNIVSGSTAQTSAGAWQAGNFTQGAGEESTWLTGTTHDFSVAGTMALPGDWTALTSGNFVFVRAGKSFQEEVAKAQRYFEKTYDDGTNPGTATFNGSINAHPGSLSGTSTTGANWQFKVTKRASPTITIYGTFAGTVNDVSITANASPPETSDVAGTIYHTGTNGTSARPTSAVAIQSMSFHGTADARY